MMEILGIEIRGGSSQSFPKKSYGFETRDKNNEDLNVSLLGFIGNYFWPNNFVGTTYNYKNIYLKD